MLMVSRPVGAHASKTAKRGAADVDTYARVKVASLPVSHAVAQNATRMGQPGTGLCGIKGDLIENTRSLHSADHRFAMICSGRDDRF